MGNRQRVQSSYAPRNAAPKDEGKTLAEVFGLYPPAPIVGAQVVNKEKEDDED